MEKLAQWASTRWIYLLFAVIQKKHFWQWPIGPFIMHSAINNSAFSPMTHFHINISSSIVNEFGPFHATWSQTSGSIVPGNCDKISTNYGKCIGPCVCMRVCSRALRRKQFTYLCWQRWCGSAKVNLVQQLQHNFELRICDRNRWHRTWTLTVFALKCIEFAMTDTSNATAMHTDHSNDDESATTAKHYKGP